MPAIEHVVRRLGPAREAADAVELAQRPEALEAPGQELVRVGLVAGVPDDPVARRLEQPVERDRQLDDAQRGPEVAARCWRPCGRSCRGSRRRAGRAGSRRARAGRRAPGWSGGSARCGGLLGRDGVPAVGRADGSIAVRVMIGAAEGGPDGRLAECKPVPCRSLVLLVVAGATGRPARGLMMEQFVVDRLRDSLHGRVTTARRSDYDAARATFNATVQRRPAVIVRVRDDDDVVAAVVAADDLGLPIAVRGGGHSVAGHAMADRRPGRRPARPTRGVGRSGDAGSSGSPAGRCGRTSMPPHGAITSRSSAGRSIDTGVAGLTLGGGIGWLSGLAGFTCDNLVRAELVTAAGERVVAGPDGDPDLLWALRGGGGNFGVVTSFEFQAIDPGPILAGYIYYPVSAVKQVLRQLAAMAETAPDALELTAQIGPHEEAPVDGLSVRVGVCWPGDIAARDRRRATAAGRAAGDLGHARADGVPRCPGDERPDGVRTAPLLEGPLPAGARRVDHRGGRRLDGRAAGWQQHDPARDDPRARHTWNPRVAPRSVSGRRPGTPAHSASGMTRTLDDSHIAWARRVGRSPGGRVADRRRVRELRPGRRADRTRPPGVRHRALRATGGDQGALRPGKPVPVQPERRAGG